VTIETGIFTVWVVVVGGTRLEILKALFCAFGIEFERGWVMSLLPSFIWPWVPAPIVD